MLVWRILFFICYLTSSIFVFIDTCSMISPSSRATDNDNNILLSILEVYFKFFCLVLWNLIRVFSSVFCVFRRWVTNPHRPPTVRPSRRTDTANSPTTTSTATDCPGPIWCTGPRPARTDRRWHHRRRVTAVADAAVAAADAVAANNHFAQKRPIILLMILDYTNKSVCPRADIFFL